MSEANKALMRRWFEEVWNKQRTDAIDEMMAPHAIAYGLAADGSNLRGPAGFKPFHQAFLDAFHDMRVTVEDVIAEGDRVAARWVAAGTHTGAGLGIAGTNRKMNITGMSIIRVENGRIVEGWNNFDVLGMYVQLGVVQMPAV
jgi:steroid delta-isomerase-like uncharacterized protein